MKIVVCVKQVPDTTEVKVDEKTGTLIREGVPSIINPFDQFAMEEGVRLQGLLTEGDDKPELIALSMGPPQARTEIMKCLALGADRGILVKTGVQLLDSAITGQALQKAIEQDGSPDVIFCGKQSIDSEGMQTPFRLAKALDLPVVTDVVGLSLGDGKAVAEREIGGGAREVVELQMPCVIAATRGLNEPHYPKLPDIMKAKKKEIKQIDIVELGVDLSAPMTEIVKLEAVAERGQARMMQGSTREMVEELVGLLKEEDKVI